ncbi:MAG: 4Fe-4S double cluster binding domain-containing protein [Desulfobacterales bacterium]|jgi:epoxyqueuosine reductase QueG
MLSGTELKEKVKAMGADLVGVADAHSPLLYEHDEKPEELLPGARSLISIAVALNRSAVCSGNFRLNRYDTMCVYERLNYICMETNRILASEGAKAVSVSPYFPVDMGPESKGMKGDINHKTVAAVAGLGGIGLSKLLVTPEFGPLVRLGTIITDASLNVDQPMDETPCKQCESCLNACPAEAIQEDGALDYRVCTSYTLSNALPGIIGIVRKLIGTDEKAVKGAIYDPHFWEIWQATASGSIYSCSECMASCPVGSD